MKSMALQATPTPVLDLLPSLLTTKTNRPQIQLTVLQGAEVRQITIKPVDRLQTMRKPAGI